MNIDDERVEELREAFEQCDADDDGLIQYGEFVTLLDNLDAQMARAESKIGFNELDTDDDQAIDFNEFLAWWADR